MSDPTAVPEVEAPGRDWQQIVFICAVAAAIVAVGVATVAYVKGVENSKAITRVEHSACQSDPAGRECQEAKRESSKAADLYTTCISFFKAGYPCPKPGSSVAERMAQRKALEGAKHSTSPTAAAAPSGGDASTNPTVHSLPAPGKGGAAGNGNHVSGQSGGEQHRHNSGNGGSVGGHEPSGEPAAPPPAPTSSSSSQQSSSSTTERVESSVEETSPEAVGPVRSAVGGVVEGLSPTLEEAGESVDGTVEAVAGTTCSLAKVLCP